MTEKLNLWGGVEVTVTTLRAEEIPFPGGVSLAMPQQTHTDNVSIVTDPATSFAETDGLISFSPDIAVGIRTADCVPLLFYASDIGAVAAVHAGWRGTMAGIGMKTLDILSSRGSSPSNVHVYIGPAICGGCYEVSEQLALDFRKAGYSAVVSSNKLDLKEINRYAMAQRGVPIDNIKISEFCTKHSCDIHNTPLFPSWRRTPGITDRLISAIRLL